MVELKCSSCGRTFYRKTPLTWPQECPSCHVLLSEQETVYAKMNPENVTLRKKSTRQGIVKGAAIGGATIAGIHRLPPELLLRKIKNEYIRRKNTAIHEGRIVPKRPKSWGAQIHIGGLRTKRQRGLVLREAAVDARIHNTLKSLRRGFLAKTKVIRRVNIVQGALTGAIVGGALGLKNWRKLKAKEKRKMIQYAIDPRIAAAKAEVKAQRIRARATQRTITMKAKAAASAASEAKWAARSKIAPTLEARIASGAGRFVKRHAGLISLLAAAPMVVREIQKQLQGIDEKRAAENYALASSGLGGRRRLVHKLVRRAKRKRRLRKGILSFPRKHTKTMLVAGGAGLGAFGAKKLQDSSASHYAFMSPPGVAERIGSTAKTTLKKTGTLAWAGTKKAGKVSAQVALGGLISWIALSILQELERKRIPAIGPYMPDVRSDIEMARYTIGQVTEHVDDIPSLQLYALQDKALKTLSTIKGLPHKAKIGAEKGLLMWLLGFISAEILGRGVTTPKRRIRVEGEVPVRNAYQKGSQPFDPKDWTAQNKAFEAGTRRIVKGVKKEKRRAAVSTAVGTARRHPGRVAAVTLPWAVLASLIAARKIRKTQQQHTAPQKYFAAAVGARALGAAAKVGKMSKLAKAGRWGNRALTAWIVADVASSVIPRKKRKPGMTSVQSGAGYRAPQYYGIAKIPVKRLMELRWLAKTKVPIKGKGEVISKGLLEVANRIRAERVAGAALAVGAGVGGAVIGKKLERRRIRKAVG